MGLLDTWREVRQQIIDSKPTYEPFITPTEYVSPYIGNTQEAEAAAPAPSAPVYDQGLLYKRRLPLPHDSDEPQQTTTYNPVETTEQLTDLMGQTPTVNAISAVLPGGILLSAAHRREIQNAANHIFGANLEGGELTFKDMLPNGNYIQRDANHFVLIVDEKNNTTQEALLTLKSTGLKTSRKWLSLMTSAKLQGKNGPFTPPTFAFTYRLKTTQESNDKGSWVAFAVSKDAPVKNASVYAQAKEFSQRMNKGNHG